MNSTGISTLALSPQLATPATLAARGVKAAQEFEAQLIGSLVESFEKTFAALPGRELFAGSEDYSHLGAQALGEALAAKGGFGIAAMIEKQISEKPFARHESNGLAVIAGPSSRGQSR